MEGLDVTDGCRVLEIGSGYNPVLLCERLGSEYVTSVDIDPELVELATERLAAKRLESGNTLLSHFLADSKG